MGSIIPEEVARTKWCPMGRAAVYAANGAITVNDPSSSIPDGHSVRCVGSRCMMWRPWPVRVGDGAPHGYCGLAPLPPEPTEMSGEPHEVVVIPGIA